MPMSVHDTPGSGEASGPGPVDGMELRRIKSTLTDAYSSGAHRYDAERSVNLQTSLFFDLSYQTIDEMLGPTGESTLHVDVPVGTGRFLFYLRDRGRGHRMVGIDIARGMIDVCRNNAVARGRTMPLAFGDAFRLPFAESSVDVLTSLRFFHLFPRRYWPELIAEMHRVIRPGGVLIVEMRNLLRGVAAGIVKEYRDRWLHDDHPHSFIAPGQIRPLFRAWGHITTRGVGLDGLGPLCSVVPGLVRRLQRLGRSGPCRYVCKELLIKARKKPCK